MEEISNSESSKTPLSYLQRNFMGNPEGTVLKKKRWLESGPVGNDILEPLLEYTVLQEIPPSSDLCSEELFV
jgi:hypothetical protein